MPQAVEKLPGGADRLKRSPCSRFKWSPSRRPRLAFRASLCLFSTSWPLMGTTRPPIVLSRTATWVHEGWNGAILGGAHPNGSGSEPNRRRRSACAIFGHLAERFKPEAMYGGPIRQGACMIVDLETPAQLAELIYLSAWALGRDPLFTPLISPAVYAEAIEQARKAPFLARGIPQYMYLRTFSASS